MFSSISDLSSTLPDLTIKNVSKHCQISIEENYPFLLRPLVGQMVKRLPTMRETWVQSLGWQDPLEKGKATHSSIWSGEFHGRYSPWGCKESDVTFIFIYLVIFGFAGSSCDSWGLLSSCGVPAQCDSSSCCRTWVLGYVGFCSCSSRALEHRLSGCGAQLSCSVECGIFPDQGSGLI